jgi:hypothetical protein
MLKSTAIFSLRPNTEFTITNDDPTTIIWHTSGITTPSDIEIQNEINRLEIFQAKQISDREAAKATALAKLEKLGLTAEEVAAAFNI